MLRGIVKPAQSVTNCAFLSHHLYSHPSPLLSFSPSRRRTIQLFPPLLQPRHNRLPPPANRPRRKPPRQRPVSRLAPHEQVSRQQQRIVLVVRPLFERHQLRRHIRRLLLQRQKRPIVRQRVLAQRARGAQGLQGKRRVLVVPRGIRQRPRDLPDVQPERAFLEVRRGFVVPREEARRHGRRRGVEFARLEDVREDGAGVHGRRYVRGVLRRPGDDEVVAEEVVVAGAEVYDALRSGDGFGAGDVRNAEVGFTRGEVLDREGGVAEHLGLGLGWDVEDLRQPTQPMVNGFEPFFTLSFMNSSARTVDIVNMVLG